MNTPMNARSKSPRLLTGLQICALIAGLAVVAWGTGYKVSLYLNLGRCRGGIPPAKLLLPEQSLASEAKAAMASAPGIPVVPLLPFLPVFLTGVWAGSLRLGAAGLATRRSDPSGPKMNPELPYFAFRPPPCIVSFSQLI